MRSVIFRRPVTFRISVTFSNFLTFGVLSTTGCNLKLPDPCAEGSPLQADPKVKEACEQMAETGDEGGDYVCATPNGTESYALCVPDNYDNNFWWVNQVQELLPGSTVDHRDCWPAAAYDAFAGYPDLGQTQPDYLCNNAGSSFASPDGIAFALEESGPLAEYRRQLPDDGWVDASMTTATTYGDSTVSVYCPRGVACVYPRSTCFCKCASDADCSALKQTEAVCELGMCFYWDEPSAPSPLPPGPPAYGFATWSEALRIDGDHVTLTPAFLLALVPGVVRDDQAFDADGRITHCGRGALCHYLGLEVGDTATADPDAVDVLLAGDAIEVEVIRADGSDRTVTVSLEFDGEL
jgi:hypothetical protein